MSDLGEDDTFAASTHTGARGPASHARFELSRGTSVGRYVVLGEIGAGAMGVVFAAYDPELDRNVALKLLDPQRSDSATRSTNRQRLLREAQALAKLSHPNVVAVHDTGEHDERVFIAMELVRGRTLRAWSKEEARRWPTVLDVFLAAGRGLAAAHAQGLVHRDFKPDNVMLGDDGRVRVMDFGLARADASVAPPDAPEDTDGRRREPVLALALTHRGAMVGTPAYMAPEQIEGKPVEPAADQFSFCASLWESLFGERPFRGETLMELMRKVLAGEIAEPPASARVPRRLRSVLQRGLAVDPRKRWPSMDALLVALQRARMLSRWRDRALAGGAVAALVVGAVAWQRHEAQRRTTACESEGEGIRAVWNDDTRAELRTALVGTDLSYAAVTADKVMPWLDAQADALQSARTDACLDTDVHGIWGTETLERAVWCLDERRSELEMLVNELTRAEPDAVQYAVRDAAALTSVEPCRDVDVLARLPLPPTLQRDEVAAVRSELSRARALEEREDVDDALAIAQDALARAEPIAWPPLTAAARLRVGSLLDGSGEYARAELELESAYFEAATHGANEVGAAAAEELAFTVGVRLARRDDGLRWSHHAEVMLAGLADPGQLREAVHLGKLAAIHRAAGDDEEALALQERVLALQVEIRGNDHPATATALDALARIHASAGSTSTARDLNERALAIREKALGPDHPDVAISLNDIAAVEVELREYSGAKAHVERALAIYEKALGTDDPTVAGIRSNLASILSSMGAKAEAKREHERSIVAFERSLGSESPHLASALNNLALVHMDMGEYESARELDERALAIRERSLGLNHPAVARILAQLAEIALAQRRMADASRFAERLLTLRERGEVPATDVAAARLLLARALVDEPQTRARAVVLAQQARDAYRDAGADAADELADAETWLADHGAARAEPGVRGVH